MIDEDEAARRALDEAEVIYRAKFGKDSLDDVVYADPLSPETSYPQAAKHLLAAVRSGKRLKTVTELDREDAKIRGLDPNEPIQWIY